MEADHLREHHKVYFISKESIIRLKKVHKHSFMLERHRDLNLVSQSYQELIFCHHYLVLQPIDLDELKHKTYIAKYDYPK